MWTVTTVADHQRGVRRRNGRIVRLLDPGRHVLWFPRAGTADALIDLNTAYEPWSPELAAVLPSGVATEVEVPFRHVAILAVDGLPIRPLLPGRYLLWQARNRVTATIYALEPLFTSIPEAQWPLVPPHLMQVLAVGPHERVVLYVDGKRVDVLGPGRYGLNVEGRAVSTDRVDLREHELQIAGQDIMTSDKVSLRVNLIVRYRVVDPVLALGSVTDLRGALYSEAQMSARRLIAGVSLDGLLEARNGAASQMLDEVRARAIAWGTEVSSLDLKDIVLPGDMKTYLNQVIEAEKKAAANVILRREETAATRSLANTAKLLEQNPTLMRLKELESLERLAQNVGQVTVVASPERLLGALRLPG
ncbi:MAG: slipin family protein [Myxococcota bacterium]